MEQENGANNMIAFLANCEAAEIEQWTAPRWVGHDFHYLCVARGMTRDEYPDRFVCSCTDGIVAWVNDKGQQVWQKETGR